MKKLNSIERYEIIARAFYLATGHMAPGKDPAPATYPASFEERFAVYQKWVDNNRFMLAYMLRAFEDIMVNENEGD